MLYSVLSGCISMSWHRLRATPALPQPVAAVRSLQLVQSTKRERDREGQGVEEVVECGAGKSKVELLAQC